MNLVKLPKLLLAASGGDTVKLFDISMETQNPCVLTYTPAPGFRVNSVKWNHNMPAKTGKISLWRKNGQSLWVVPAKNARGEIVEDVTSSTFSQLTPSPAFTNIDDSPSITPLEAWGGEKLSDKLGHHRQSISKPSRFATLASTSNSSSALVLSGFQDSGLTYQSTSSLTSGLSLSNLHSREPPNHEILLGYSEAVSSPIGTKSFTPQANFDNLGPALSLPRRFSSYAERIGATPSFSDASSFPVASPKSKKMGAETREELLNSLLSKSEMTSATGTSVLTNANGGVKLILENQDEIMKEHQLL